MDYGHRCTCRLRWLVHQFTSCLFPCASPKVDTKKEHAFGRRVANLKQTGNIISIAVSFNITEDSSLILFGFYQICKIAVTPTMQVYAIQSHVLKLFRSQHFLFDWMPWRTGKAAKAYIIEMVTEAGVHKIPRAHARAKNEIHSAVSALNCPWKTSQVAFSEVLFN